jgi:N-acetylglucosamine kinase-like BadF-type ATPase
MLASCEVAKVDDLIAWAGRARKSEFASLAPLVLEAADRGDPGAREIAEEAAAALEEHLVALRVDDGAEVVLWGGLLADGGPLRERVVDRVTARGWRVATGDIDPPMGAARLALSLAQR